MTTRPPDLRPDLKQRVLAAARREPSPTRAITARRGAILAVLAVLGPVAIFFAVGGLRPDQRPAPHVALTALGWAAIAAVATWQAFGRGRSMLGRPRGRVLVVSMLTPLLLLGWVLVCNAAYPEAVIPCPPVHGLVCLGWTLALAAAPFVALTLARRASDPVHPLATGAALGAAAGAWGAVMIDLRCSFATLSHVALGHALPVVLLAGLGTWVGSRVIAVRGATD